jgi:hypothetical protein
MEEILVKMEKVEKMEKILVILEKIIVTIPIHRGTRRCSAGRAQVPCPWHGQEILHHSSHP